MILMMGTDPRGAGGIASVLNAYQQAGLFEPADASLHSVTYVTTHREAPRWRTGLLWATAVGALIMARIRRPVQIVHVHSASRGSFLRKSILLWLARTLGCHTVFHLHGGGFQTFVEQQIGPLGRWWVLETLTHVTLVLALSERWRDYILTLAPTARVEILPNPVAIEPTPIRRPEPGRILFLGRLDPRKGVYDLVTAIAAVNHTMPPGSPELRLVVAGDGDGTALAEFASRAGVGGQLERLGWISPTERSHQLARASLFVLPSHHEGVPMSMLEAMSARVPIIVSSVGGIPDLVTHGVHGLVVPPGDIKALGSALAQLVFDLPLQETLASAARERIRSECATEIVMSRLRSLWQSLDPEAPPIVISLKVPT
jgi:glycosyltransferase involved in cell wall biosynthesis